MNYKKYIDAELKPIAINMPYSKAIIGFANIYQTVSLKFTSVPKEVAAKNITIEGYKGLKFKTEIFEPSDTEGKSLPCLIYLHGGAFSYKASSYHKVLACLYAAKAKCRVYFPDYHLLPNYPYPAAYNDVLSLYRFIAGNSDERIGVAGDSAGAALAALICNNYERETLKPPCLQMLVYPATDVSMRTNSMKRFSDTPLWNSKNNRLMWSYYCSDLKGYDIYAVSPMHSELPEAIPYTYIETAEYDCLHDEGILYGEKLRKAGANVEVNETPKTIHGYDSALNSKIAAENIEKRILFLQKGFGSCLSG